MKNIRLISSFTGLLLALFVSLGANAQDVTLSVDKMYLNPGSTATVKVKIDNKVNFGSMKTTITLPEGLSFATSKTLDDGTFNYVYGTTNLTKGARFIFNSSNKSEATLSLVKSDDFAPCNGDFFTFDVDVDNNFAPMGKIFFSGTSATFTDTSVEPWTQTRYNQEAFSAKAYNESELFTPSVKDFSIKAGETKKVEFALDYDKHALSGLEFNIALPEGLTIDKSSYTASTTRIPNHFITVKKSGRIGIQPDGSSNDLDINGTTGTLFTFEVTAAKDYSTDKAEIKFYDFEAVTKSVNGVNTLYYAKDFTVNVNLDTATGIDGISADKFAEAADGIYQLNGVRTDKLQRGVNIVVKDGKAVKVVKK